MATQAGAAMSAAALFTPADQAPAYGETRDHPAKFNAAILAELSRLIWLEAHRLRRSRRDVIVLDPFAGTGRLQWVARGPVRVLCSDLEPEWISQAPDGGFRADATALPLPDGCVDVIATSCTYANRMADLYDGRDGSRRHTYRIDLGRLPSPGSSCGMQWGTEYRRLHEAAWVEAWRVLHPGGLLAVNIKDHQRGGVWQQVPEWHAGVIERIGFDVEGVIPVEADGLRHGSNWDDRAEHELIIAARRTAEGAA
jgi:SAM-dependent methyltransferase